MISGQGSFSGATQSKQKRHISILPFIGTSMHTQDSSLGHEVMHHPEKTFFHFPSVLGTQNNHPMSVQIHTNRSFGLRVSF
jgi:hypothetical protein